MVDETRPTDSPQKAPETSVDNGAASDIENLQADSVEATEETTMAAEAVTEETSTDEEASLELEIEGAQTSEDRSDGAEPQANASQQPVIAELEAQITALKAQLEDRTGQYMRIAADFENYRRRISKEREEQELQVKCNTIAELLPVIDNFERARAQIKPQTEPEMTIHKSYQSVYKQLVDCLKRLGVSAMRAEGQEFDPMLHEAVMREPTDQYPEGTVIEELVRGYLIGDRVLRHAMVKVAAPPEPESAEAGATAPTE